jgi:hypothetical protein
MYGADWKSTVNLESLQDDPAELRRYVIDETAKRLFEAAIPVADDSGLDDFSEIMNFDGNEGISPLEGVIDELAAIAENYPAIIETFRGSDDWEDEVHSEDAFRAASAAVAESLEAAAGLWNDRASSLEV